MAAEAAQMTTEDARAAAQAEATAAGPGAFPVLGAHLLERRGRVLDLTRPIFEGMPQWFGHQRTFIMTNQDHEEFRRLWKTTAGFEARNLLMSEHCGTHTDAIIEYDPDGPRLDEVPLAFYWGEAVCLDLSGVKWQDPDPQGHGYATETVIRQAEARLAESGEEIRPGDIVLLWFDHGDRTFPSPKFMAEYPGVSWDGAEYLARKGVVNIGTDCPGIDNSHDPEFSGHMVCKKYGIVNTENLANLGELVGRRFQFFGLPLHIQGGTGSPIRAIAWFPPPDDR
jgi:kynurenine formamidase